VATPAPTKWHHQDPELWPSITQASALLLALEALARLQQHLALMDEQSWPSQERQEGTPAAASTRPQRRSLLSW
jgi:hypothetical protein